MSCISQLLRKASVHVIEGESNAALGYFREAVRVHPLSVEAWKAWAQFELDSGALYRSKLYFKIANMADRARIDPEINIRSV